MLVVLRARGNMIQIWFRLSHTWLYEHTQRQQCLFMHHLKTNGSVDNGVLCHWHHSQCKCNFTYESAKLYISHCRKAFVITPQNCSLFDVSNISLLGVWMFLRKIVQEFSPNGYATIHNKFSSANLYTWMFTNLEEMILMKSAVGKVIDCNLSSIW